MKPTAAITLAPPLTPARTQPPTVLEMMERVLDRGFTSESVAVLAELNKLHEAIDRRNAEKEFNAAFVELQAEMPRIQTTQEVRYEGKLQFKFAPFENLMAQLQPLLQKHGFAVSFSEKNVPPMLTAYLTLAHKAGHSIEREFTVRAGQDRMKAGETTVDLAASTRAKRYCMIHTLNIVVTHAEDDAGALGRPINPEQVEELRELVKRTGTVEISFLKFAASKDFESIMSNRYDELHEYLSKRERVQKQKAQ